MATFLFDKIIFGPVNSRRLGNSLGINLLPADSKFCNFNCIYCECGFTPEKFGRYKDHLPEREEISNSLENALTEFRRNGTIIDSITFAGNGEPTLHPDFPGIIDDTIALRNKFYPKTKIAVLSNATLINKKAIRNALIKADDNILKLDSADEEIIRLINCPSGSFSLEILVENLKEFRGNLTIQTLFFKGNYKGKSLDNSKDEDVESLTSLLTTIKPKQVMIYTISRDTPVKSLYKISGQRLEAISEKMRSEGLHVSISP